MGEIGHDYISAVDFCHFFPHDMTRRGVCLSFENLSYAL